MEMASGTISTVKAMVSSLIPKTAPKTENSSMISTRTILFTPTARSTRNLSSREVKARNECIPASTALAELTIQNAPPMISRKTIMPAWAVNPS